MNNKESANEVLTEVFKLVEKIGCKNTVKYLQDGKYELYYDKKIADYIVDLSCETFGITKDRLLHSRTTGRRTDALAVCSFLFDNIVGYSQPEIANYFGKDTSSINKYIKKINELNPSHKEDSILLDKLKHVKDETNKLLDNIRTQILNDYERQKS